MSASIPNHVHFVGIGGIGMSALARYFLAGGHEVSGSDRFPGEQGEALAALGARVYTGHRAEQVDSAEMVVVTSAVAGDNPEVRAARSRGIPVVKRAELLAAIANAARGIAVAGTHGKTTTSALIGHILTEAGLDPTILIGGVSKNLGSNARVSKSIGAQPALAGAAGREAASRGSDEHLVVVEADEYDASFLYLQPWLGVMTNVEREHLDFYRSEDRMRQAFKEFARSVRDTLVVCADDRGALDAAGGAPARLVTYGVREGDWRATDIAERGDRVTFRVRRGASEQECATRLGRHVVINAVGAFAAAEAMGVEVSTIARALETFEGVARRFDVRGEVRGVLVMDDYAHHPSEIRVTLEAIEERYRRPMRVVFQPHTYSRTRDLLDEFAGAFSAADTVYLLDIYAARETDRLGMTGQRLAETIGREHPCVTYTETMDGTLQALLEDLRPGDLAVTMGAGDVYQLAPRLLEGLERG